MTPQAVAHCRTLPPERIVEVAESAHGWLVSLLERMHYRGDIAARAYCDTLIASWIAEQLMGSKSVGTTGFVEIARHVGESLSANDEFAHTHAVNSRSKLLVEILLTSQGQSVVSLRQFLSKSVSVLRQLNHCLDSDPSLMDKRVLLHGAGLLPRPPNVSTDDLHMLLADFRLSSSAEVIDALILELECLTGWGTQPIDSEQIPSSLEDIVAGFAVQRLRKYELIPAARLLRLHEYLVANRAGTRRADLQKALLIQHQAHGPFGWYGPEIASLRRQNPDSSADIEFHLPTTLELLWTLAESSMGGWRLFDQVPPYLPFEDD